MTSKKSWAKFLLYDLKSCTRYPPHMRYGDTKVRELKALKEAHPRTSAEDIDNGTHTHKLMTGGMFLFNDEPVPDHILLPKAMADFQECAPRVLGRPVTYDDLFWLSLSHVQAHASAWEMDACITEVISTPYHNFFVDLDLIFQEPHESAEVWREFVKMLCLSVGRGLLSCFPDVATNGDPLRHFDFTVLTTKGYHAKAEGDRMLYKRGIHLVWPGLVVDKDRSQALALAIDENLTKNMPRDRRAGENSWKDALDLSVYSSGLRTAGSPRLFPCPTCRTVATKKISPGFTYDTCARHLDYIMCHPPTGLISQGEESVYAIEYISRGDGVLLSKKRFEEKIEACVLKDDVADRTFDFSLKRLTSIRATATDMTPGFDPPSHLRKPILLDVAEYRVHPHQDPESGDFLREPKRKGLVRTGSELIVSKEAMQFVTRLVQDYSPKYKALVVDKLWAFPTEDRRKMLPPKWGEEPKTTLYSHIWVLVKGSGSNYCHLKPGEHTSSSIRFVLHYDGTLAQECWGQKVGMTGKPCCRSSTKGMVGFLDKVRPADYGPLADLFRMK